MNEDKELKEKAKEIKSQLQDEQEEITLDAPEPSQTNENRSKNKPEEREPEPKKEPVEATKENEDKFDQPSVGGYTLGDALMAPVKPPSPDISETPGDTRNAKVKIMMAIGLLLVIFGALIALAGVVILGLILAVLGAVIITIDVFARIR